MSSLANDSVLFGSGVDGDDGSWEEVMIKKQRQQDEWKQLKAATMSAKVGLAIAMAPPQGASDASAAQALLSLVAGVVADA